MKVYCLNNDNKLFTEIVDNFNKYDVIVENFVCNFIPQKKIRRTGVDNVILENHLQLLKFLKTEKSSDYYLILENNVTIVKDFNLSDIVKSIPLECDVLYMGGMNHYHSPLKVDDTFYRCIYSFNAHAYIVKASFIDTIIEYVELRECEIDVIYAKMQENSIGKWYGLIDDVIIQKSKSFITKVEGSKLVNDSVVSELKMKIDDSLNERIISELYVNILKRGVDETGLKHYLNDKSLNRQKLTDILKNCIEYKLQNHIFEYDNTIDCTFMCGIQEGDGLGKLGLRYFIESREICNSNIHVRGFIDDVDNRSWINTVYENYNNKIGRNILSMNPDIEFPDYKGIKKWRYHMFEADTLPEFWSDKFKAENLSGIFVPSDFCKKIFEKSLPDIPIYTIPHGIDAENIKYNKFKDNLFTFGLTSQLEERKNHSLLISAFKIAFPENDKVRLKIHGRWGHLESKIASECEDDYRIDFLCEKLNTDNYEKWWKQLDCYVLCSAGEGYSFTPREALIRKIPTIISSWGAHEDLVKLGCVDFIDPVGFEPAYKYIFAQKTYGNHAVYSVDDLANKMLDVYNNFELAKKKAEIGNSWIRKNETWKKHTATMLEIMNRD